MKDLIFDSESNNCNVPVVSIWRGQVPTKTIDTVIIHNFLPNTVLGFMATVDVDDGGDIDNEGMPAPTESLSDFADKMIETCDDCPDAGPTACDDCENFK